MGLSAIIRDIHKRNTEWASGKITKWGSLWEWIEYSNLPDEIATRFDAGETDISIISELGNRFYKKMGDRHAVLSKGVSVSCPFLDIYPDAVPIQREDGAIVGRFVPFSVCQKCEHYRSVKNSPERFPICALARQVRTNGESPKSVAAKQTLGAYTSALQDTSKELSKAGL